MVFLPSFAHKSSHRHDGERTERIGEPYFWFVFWRLWSFSWVIFGGVGFFSLGWVGFFFLSDYINFSLKFLWGIASHLLWDRRCLRGWAGKKDGSRSPPAAAAGPRGAGAEGSALPARRGTPLPPAEGTETLTGPGPASPPGPRGRPPDGHRRIGAPPGPGVAEDAEDAEDTEDAFGPALGCECSPSSITALRTVSNPDRFRATGFFPFPPHSFSVYQLQLSKADGWDVLSEMKCLVSSWLWGISTMCVLL